MTKPKRYIYVKRVGRYSATDAPQNPGTIHDSRTVMEECNVDAVSRMDKRRVGFAEAATLCCDAYSVDDQLAKPCRHCMT